MAIITFATSDSKVCVRACVCVCVCMHVFVCACVRAYIIGAILIDAIKWVECINFKIVPACKGTEPHCEL